jgi:hypothetical protein
MVSLASRSREPVPPKHKLTTWVAGDRGRRSKTRLEVYTIRGKLSHSLSSA